MFLRSSVLVSLSLLAPTSSQLTENLLECATSANDVVDFFPQKYTKASIFTYNDDTDINGNKFVPHNTTDLLDITYHGTYKIVHNKHINVTYLLYQCGTEPPAEEIGKHHLVLPVPHKGGLVVTQTTQIPPIELLGLREEIVGYFGDPSFVSSPCMQYMMNNESSIEVVFDATYNYTLGQELQADFFGRNPDALVFVGPNSPGTGPREIGVAASQERTNVATFDWIALFAALYNLEAESTRIARETQARYDCSSSNAAILASTSTERELQASPVKKKVLWANYFAPYNWSVAECPTWDNTYYCEYAKHCGADIVSRPEGYGNTVSFGGPQVYWYLDDQQLLELGKDADVWIYSGTNFESVYEEKKEFMDQFKAVQDELVYDIQGQGSTAWFEQRLAEYDVVTLDFCDIVGNSNPDNNHERRWFRHVFTEAIGGALGECRVPEEISEPYVAIGAECTPLDTESEPEAPAEPPVEAPTNEEVPASPPTEREPAEPTVEAPTESTDEASASKPPHGLFGWMHVLLTLSGI